MNSQTMECGCFVTAEITGHELVITVSRCRTDCIGFKRLDQLIMENTGANRELVKARDPKSDGKTKEEK